MPGVSGDEKVYRPRMPGAILAGAAKLAGVVPTDPEARDFPRAEAAEMETMRRPIPRRPAGAEVDMSEILFGSAEFRGSRAAKSG